MQAALPSHTSAKARPSPCARCAFRMPAALTALTPSTARMVGQKKTSAQARPRDHNRVLFWKGDTVVDATFSHIGPMSAE